MDKLSEIQRVVLTLQMAVVGDKLNGKPGVVDLLETHRRELYGDLATQHQGLKERMDWSDRRLTNLEEIKRKMLWTWAGISTGTGVTIGVILWLIEWMSKKP